MRHCRTRRFVCVLISLLLLIGCGGYGEVSETAYDFSKALYSITNRKATDKLDQVCEQIEAARSAGELTEQESSWLLQIASDARRGDWDSAMGDARRMMEDQVR